MLSGMTYMHQQGIVNRDVKIENMLIGDDYTIKIADFGYAIPIEGRKSDGKIRTRLGSPGYMAPELLEQEHEFYHGEKVDIFALGVTLFTMRSVRYPFRRNDSRGEYWKLLEEFIVDKTKYWSDLASLSFSEELKSLLNAMMNYDPALRPSAADILTHPWMMGQMASQEQTAQELMTR